MIRYTLALIGYIMLVTDLLMILGTPVWNKLFDANFRMRKINKNR